MSPYPSQPKRGRPAPSAVSDASRRKATITVEDFGALKDGRAVQRLVVNNEAGASFAVLTYGALLTSLKMPDGREVTINKELLDDVIQHAGTSYAGAVCGRVANRIKGGSFTLNQQTYKLPCNQNGHHLHGGNEGFDKKLWELDEVVFSPQEVGVVLKYDSPDGEEGYPGNLAVCVLVSLARSSLQVNIQLFAECLQKDTIVNMCSHAYYNLNGRTSGKDVLNHKLNMRCPKYVQVSEDLIPTGKLLTVKEHPAFDFTAKGGKRVGEHIDQVNTHMGDAFGYDHYFMVDQNEKSDAEVSKAAGNSAQTADAAAEDSGNNDIVDGGLEQREVVVHGKFVELPIVATLESDDGDLVMHVATSEPGLQVCTANYFPPSSTDVDVDVEGKKDSSTSSLIRRHGAICLETQKPPDAINQPNFPSVVLRRGDVYESTTVLLFEGSSVDVADAGKDIDEEHVVKQRRLAGRMDS
jgi:aldose 1-epimerase